jgi:hypothetical protein
LFFAPIFPGAERGNQIAPIVHPNQENADAAIMILDCYIV